MKNQDAPYFSDQVIRANRFYRKLPEEKNYWDSTELDRLHVVAAGFERCRSGYAIHRKDFPYFSVEFVADGTGQLKLQGTECELSRGTIFVYGPQLPHAISSTDEKGLAKYFLNISGPDAAGLLQSAGLPPGTVTQVAAPGELQPLFNELIRNGQKHSSFSGRICVSLTELILMKIEENALPFPGRNSRGYRTFSRCRSIIEQDFITFGSLEEAAVACNVGTAYLCRLFKQFAHQSPYQYLVRLKLNRAAEILHDPSVMVKEAAWAVGFTDPFHFSRVFTRFFGISPAKYKATYGKESD